MKKDLSWCVVVEPKSTTETHCGGAKWDYRIFFASREPSREEKLETYFNMCLSEVSAARKIKLVEGPEILGFFHTHADYST